MRRRYKGGYRRRRNNKRLFIFVLIIILIGGLIYVYNNGKLDSIKFLNLSSIKFLNSNSIIFSSFDSIKDISKNGDSFIGKQIKIRGKMIEDGMGKALADNEGYYIYVGEPLTVHNSCIQRGRVYDKGQIYTAEGTLSSKSILFNSYNYINCNIPIE